MKFILDMVFYLLFTFILFIQSSYSWTTTTHHSLTQLRSNPSLKTSTLQSYLSQSSRLYAKQFDDLPESVRYTINSLKEQTAQLTKTLQDEESRGQAVADFMESLRISSSSILKNLGEGEVGKRGEVWFLTQMTLFLFVLLGVPGLISGLIHLSGWFTLLAGAYFILGGSSDLRENTSPFVTPCLGNELVTKGVYQIVRHPMYAGLILSSLGISIISDSASKLVLTLALGVVLVRTVIASIC